MSSGRFHNKYFNAIVLKQENLTGSNRTHPAGNLLRFGRKLGFRNHSLPQEPSWKRGYKFEIPQLLCGAKLGSCMTSSWVPFHQECLRES